MTKYLLVSLALFFIPIFNAQHVLGSWLFHDEDEAIEDHLSKSSLSILKDAFGNTESKSFSTALKAILNLFNSSDETL